MGTVSKNDVLITITEYIFQNHKFPSCSEIIESVNVSKSKCLDICQELVDDGQFYVVFEGSGNPTIYVPYDMMQGLLRTQLKPDWVDNYSFSNEPDLEEKIEQIKEELVDYKLIQASALWRRYSLRRGFSSCS